MNIIRPIALEDRDRFIEMAFQTSMGITSLPKDADQLCDKLLQSQMAFDEKILDPHHHLYIFVLENLETNQLLGTCAIKAKTAVEEPTYVYRIENIDNTAATRHVPKTLKVLRAVEIRHGPSEICGLYLMPEHRSSNLGYLLSYSRFLFMAIHPRRFDDKVIAEMRGYFDENGKNAFWTWVGRHFYDVEYDEAIERQSHTTTFIPDILPKFPLYFDLLPHEVQRIIGKTHDNTKAALNLLRKIGFSFTNEVDIFDAGPKMWAPVQEVTVIANSHSDRICGTKETLPETEWLIANTGLREYRACIGRLESTPDGILIHPDTALALKLKEGDPIRYTSW